MLTETAPVGQRSAHGPQYQHSSTCMYALPVSGSIASESSGHTSTQRVHPEMQRDSSMVTGTSARLGTRGMGGLQAAGNGRAASQATRRQREMRYGEAGLRRQDRARRPGGAGPRGAAPRAAGRWPSQLLTGPLEHTGHGDAVASEADELQIHGAPVGEAGQPLQHQQGGALRRLQDGGGVR